MSKMLKEANKICFINDNFKISLIEKIDKQKIKT